MFPKEILPVIDQPEQVQEQAFTPDLRIPKTVLWSLRRNKSLGSLTETDEGRIGVLSTLAGHDLDTSSYQVKELI